jgi:hypothetical protein
MGGGEGTVIRRTNSPLTVEATRTLPEEEALALWRDTKVADLPPHPLLVRPTTGEPRPVIVTLDGEPIIAQTYLTPTTLTRHRAALLDFPIINGVTRAAGISNRSQVFGNLAKNPLLQRSCCRPCAAAETAPRPHRAICALAETLADALHELVPAQYDANVAALADVHRAWLLPGGLWTSGVVNLSSALPYHRDRNNFNAWSAMPVVRRGVRGGHLHFPELEVDGIPLVAPCADGDVLLFNGQHFMHGVTPLRYAMKDGYRYSCVYYPVRRFANCLEPAAELAHAQAQRTMLEDTLVARQTAAGYLHAETLTAELDALGIHNEEHDDD